MTGESPSASTRTRETLTGLPLALAVLVRALRAELRFGDATELKIAFAELVEVRRREALVVCAPTVALAKDLLGPYMDGFETGSTGLLVVGPTPTGLLEKLPTGTIVGFTDIESADALYAALHGLLERVELRLSSERRGRWLNRYRYELGELIEIARAVTLERDTDRLLGLILEKSRFITGSDAGSIYVLEGTDPDVTRRTLRFKLSQNESISFESKEFTMPVSTRSIAGAAVVGRKPISLPDVYTIPPDAPYGFDRSFDVKVGYRTRSMMVVPMISTRDEVIGVIQLINKKREPARRLRTPADFDSEVVEYDQRSEELLQTLAAQAGIALENAMLYDEIRAIFEGFVRASVQAIEQRDPTTSGHSLRVSLLSVKLAEMLDREGDGIYAGVTFSKRDLKELEYASLLHDFGKIGVREQVLVKAKKLYPHELDAVRARFDFVLRSEEAAIYEKKVKVLLAGEPREALDRLDDELSRRRAEIEAAWKVVSEANEPTVLKEGDFTRIGELGQITYVDSLGELRPLLSGSEVTSLQVQRGSLNTVEFDEIRSHVVHTYNFLAKIPWGRTFDRVPLIAGAHHERLNGHGYPNHWTSEQIPLQSKIMSVADIFDALTASDRPYKRALPLEKALQILSFEVKDGHIDGELVRIFREAQVFKVVEGDVRY